MPEAPAVQSAEVYLTDEGGRKRNPRIKPLVLPAAQARHQAAAEAPTPLEGGEPGSRRHPFPGGEDHGLADVMQDPLPDVDTKKQGPGIPRRAQIAAHHQIGAPPALHLHHRSFPGSVGKAGLLRHEPFEPLAARSVSQPRAISGSCVWGVTTSCVFGWTAPASCLLRSPNQDGRRSTSPTACRSKATKQAGAAGRAFVPDPLASRRSSNAWKSRRPSRATTISPSTTQASGRDRSDASTSSGKYGSKLFRLRLAMWTEVASLKINPRKPSHFGS